MGHSASKFYSVMVVGENPEELLAKYKRGLKVKEYVKYRYLDAEKLQKNSVKILNEVCNNYRNFNLSNFQVDAIKEKLKAIKNMTPFEYYQTITYGCKYDENGDAWSDINPDGKYNSYQKGGHFSKPLILNNGETTTSAYCKDINWEQMQYGEAPLYSLAWKLAVEGQEPKNEQEAEIKSNMEHQKAYLSKFKNMDDYVSYCASYWNYAFLDENGWIDMDDKGSQKDWINNFYKRFISKLKPTDKVSIFEYNRNSDEDEEL